MKIIFKNTKNTKNLLFVNIDKKKEIEEIIKEGDKKILNLKLEEKINLRKTILFIRKIIFLSKNKKIDQVVIDFQDLEKLYNNINFQNNEKIKFEEFIEIVSFQLIYTNYEFNQYKSNKDNNNLKEIYIKNCSKKEEDLFKKGLLIAEEINKSRDLSNMSGGDMTPEILAKNAKNAVSKLPVKVSILGEKEIKKLKMEAILAVGRGSEEESKFIIMEYFGGDKKNKKEKPIILIGKGVTFDTGGINLKPSSGLSGMNMDMSGGAIAIHTISLVAKMKLKKNIIVLIPAVENSLSGKSYRPGDVIKSLSGKTIEVLNTDAEGRVILADALTYSQKYNPKIVIDIATLTGSSMVALGERMSALFTDDENLAKKLENFGNITGDYVWRLPMWEEYESDIKGSLGDFANISNKNSPYGGAILGAIFLKQFIDQKYSWAHIDIAPRMVSIDGDYLAKGATGSPLYLLYKFIENE